jgi:hypothetical protein
MPSVAFFCVGRRTTEAAVGAEDAEVRYSVSSAHFSASAVPTASGLPYGRGMWYTTSTPITLRQAQGRPGLHQRPLR